MIQNILKSKKATYVANAQEQVVELTQSQITTPVGASKLLFAVEYDFIKNNRKSISVYCDKANLTITYGSNGHLRTNGHAINTYLLDGFDKILVKWIKNNFNIIHEQSQVLPNTQISETLNTLEYVTTTDRESTPILELAEYEEPHYDDANCNGYPMMDFLGIIGKKDETIEISFHKNDKLFAPSNGKSTKEYIVGSDFNLYDQNGENLGWTETTTLVCSYEKTHNIFEVKLLSTVEIDYFGEIIKPYEPKQIAVGILQERIKYVGWMEELLDEDYLVTPVVEKIDETELPW